MIERAVAGGLLHGPQDLAVVGEEHAGVGHEQLEAGDALVDQRVHVLERLLVDVADDLVEAVVDGALALGLGEPLVEAVAHALAVALHGEVDDGGGAAPGCGPGAGLEVVRRDGAAEGQLHVGVAVDAAGDDVETGRVDDAFGAGLGRDRQVGARLEHRDDDLAVDEHLGRVGAGGGDHGAVLDERGHDGFLGVRWARARLTVQSMDRMVSTSAATPSSISASVTLSMGVMRMTLP